MPTGKIDTEDLTRRFQTGDGEFNQLFHVNFGVSLSPIPGYIGGGFF